MKLWNFIQDWIIATLADRVQRAKVVGFVLGGIAYFANIDYAKQLFPLFPVSWQPVIVYISGACSIFMLCYGQFITPNTPKELPKAEPPPPSS